MGKIDYSDKETLRALVAEDTKNAIKKVTSNSTAKKKLSTDGSFVKRLKDSDYVEINPDKPDLISQATR
jgi:hypothetical protein